MPEEELLDVQKCSALGRTRAGDVPGNEGTEGENRAERGLQEPGERSWILGCGNRRVPVFAGVPGGTAREQLPLAPIPALPSPEDEEPCDSELSLAFSQGRGAEPWPGWELPSFPGH